jgi:hypothetical protein
MELEKSKTYLSPSKLRVIIFIDGMWQIFIKTTEKEQIELLNEICIESLPPELFENWDKIKNELIKNRHL